MIYDHDDSSSRPCVGNAKIAANRDRIIKNWFFMWDAKRTRETLGKTKKNRFSYTRPSSTLALRFVFFQKKSWCFRHSNFHITETENWIDLSERFRSADLIRSRCVRHVAMALRSTTGWQFRMPTIGDEAKKPATLQFPVYNKIFAVLIYCAQSPLKGQRSPSPARLFLDRPAKFFIKVFLVLLIERWHLLAFA